MTHSLLQSDGQPEHHELHAFAFERIGQGSPHDLPSLTEKGVGAVLDGVGAQTAIEAELLARHADQRQQERGQREREEQPLAA